MTLSSVTVLAGANTFVADITATADADTALAIPHGLGAAPVVLGFAPSDVEARRAAAALSGWGVLSDATNLTVVKGTAVGSGVAGIQIRISAALPHSLAR